MHDFEGKGTHIYSTPTHMTETGYISSFIVQNQICFILVLNFNLTTILRGWYLLSPFYRGRKEATEA